MGNGLMRVRYFDPRSVIWRVDQEMVLLLGGGRALLMQLAHPKVAAGVADHSRFRRDPMGRLYQTMNTMWSIVFDEIAEADASLERVQQIHRRVRGTVEGNVVLPKGTRYDARDPELLAWVHATLVDSAVVTYEHFVGPLSVREKRLYYDGAKRLAFLFGVPEAEIPGSLDDFNEYMTAMLHGDTISVDSTARALAGEILSPRPWILKGVSPVSRFITIGLLPPGLRDAYGLVWNHRKERALGLLAGGIRRLLPLIPRALRIVPHARAAELTSMRDLSRCRVRVERSQG